MAEWGAGRGPGAGGGQRSGKGGGHVGGAGGKCGGGSTYASGHGGDQGDGFVRAGPASVADRPKYVPPALRREQQNATAGRAAPSEQQMPTASRTAPSAADSKDGAGTWTPSLLGSRDAPSLGASGKGGSSGQNQRGWGAVAGTNGHHRDEQDGNWRRGAEHSYSSTGRPPMRRNWNDDDDEDEWGAGAYNGGTGAASSSKAGGKNKGAKGARHWDEGASRDGYRDGGGKGNPIGFDESDSAAKKSGGKGKKADSSKSSGKAGKESGGKGGKYDGERTGGKGSDPHDVSGKGTKGGKNDGERAGGAVGKGGKGGKHDSEWGSGKGAEPDGGVGKGSGKKGKAQGERANGKGSEPDDDLGRGARDGGKAAGKKSPSEGKAARVEGGKAGSGKDAGGEDKGGKAASWRAVTAPKATGKTAGKANGRGDEHEPVVRKGYPGTGAVNESHLSEQRFSELKVSAETRRALAQGFGYEFMTRVQAATVYPLLDGKDVVARAKTGTGKTLAFLVPIVERIKGSAGGVGGPISALILSPTRELASQISHEAEVLLGYHKQLGVACFYGGVNIKGDKDALDRRPCDILVATPGRLTDHLQNTAGFSRRLSRLAFLALDEADQLLDMGFRDAIMGIINALPPASKRQGALFSATFPDSVSDIAKLALRNDFQMLDTVLPHEEVTPDQIEQSVVVTDIENMMETLWYAVSHEKNRLRSTHKIMVFFVTARLTQYYAQQFCNAGMEVLEIHSRKSQPHRTKCADQFRRGQSGIVFSSDVMARGLDMPDVTAVIQVGVPSSRDQYIHRLGRTGRAGKSGCCLLLLHDFETYFLQQLRDLPVKKLSVNTAFSKANPAPEELWSEPDGKTGGQAYQAWLGYYNSAKGLGMPKERLVREATNFAYSIGMVGSDGLPPPILKRTAGMMGLKGVPGLNVVSQLPYNE